MTHEAIIDHDFVSRAFAEKGGAKQRNKILGKPLDEVVNTLSASLWDINMTAEQEYTGLGV